VAPAQWSSPYRHWGWDRRCVLPCSCGRHGRAEGLAVKLSQPPDTRRLGPVDRGGGTFLRWAPCFTCQRSQHLVWKYIHLAMEPSCFTRPHPYHRMMSVSAIGWPHSSQRGSSLTSLSVPRRQMAKLRWCAWWSPRYSPWGSSAGLGATLPLDAWWRGGSPRSRPVAVCLRSAVGG
jgi:hypothetical protein